MQKIHGTFRRFKHGPTLIKSFENKSVPQTDPQRTVVLEKFVRSKSSDRVTRGLLPWESHKCVEEPKKPTKKRFVDDHIKTFEPRIKSSWRIVLDKSVCEMRRLKKCLIEFGDNKDKCQNLAPKLVKTNKVYPARETTGKNIPGCAKPLPGKSDPEPTGKQEKK